MRRAPSIPWKGWRPLAWGPVGRVGMGRSFRPPRTDPYRNATPRDDRPSGTIPSAFPAVATHRRPASDRRRDLGRRRRVSRDRRLRGCRHVGRIRAWMLGGGSMRTQQPTSAASTAARLRSQLARLRRRIGALSPAVRWSLALGSLGVLVLLGYLAAPVPS